MKRSASLCAGLLTLATALDAAAYTHATNVNGTGASARAAETGLARVGLGNDGEGLQYHHWVDGLAPGETWSVTGDQYAMFDPMRAASGDASAYGVGAQSWCQGGECDPDQATGAPGAESFGWNHTSQHILFTLTQATDVTISLSSAPEVTGKHTFNTSSGRLAGDLVPAFTLFAGKSTTGINDTNHVWANMGATPHWSNITYLGHDANTANANRIERTYHLEAGDYTLYIGGNKANNSLGKNFALSIAAASLGNPPSAQAGPDQSVRQGALVTLDGSASTNPDGAALSYRWTQLLGPAVSLSSDTAARPTFTAPNVGSSTVLTFQLVVRDTRDGQTSDPDVVNITVGPNQAPTADAGSNGSIRGGSIRTLDGSGSYDPDGDHITYAWTQVAGPMVTLDNPAASRPGFVAPGNSIGASIVFALTVSDGLLESNVANVSTTLVANGSPTVDLGADRAAREGATVALSANVADPDGDALSYQWRQTAGTPVDLAGADTATASFTAPGVGPAGEELRFELTATDDYAPGPLSTSAAVKVMVGDDDALLDCSQAQPSRSRLWPPKKGMVKIQVQGVTGPRPYRIAITGITQDEPVRDKAAGDRTGPDAKIQKQRRTKRKPYPQDSALLRAERQDLGDGRVYEIGFTATDGSQSCDGSVRVGVPLTAAGNARDADRRYDSMKKK